MTLPVQYCVLQAPKKLTLGTQGKATLPRDQSTRTRGWMSCLKARQVLMSLADRIRKLCSLHLSPHQDLGLQGRMPEIHKSHRERLVGVQAKE